MNPAELCLKHGIQEATYQNRKVKYSGMPVCEAQCLKALEQVSFALDPYHDTSHLFAFLVPHGFRVGMDHKLGHRLSSEYRANNLSSLGTPCKKTFNNV